MQKVKTLSSRIVMADGADVVEMQCIAHFTFAATFVKEGSPRK